MPEPEHASPIKLDPHTEWYHCNVTPAIPVLVFGLIFAGILRIFGGSETRWEHVQVPFVFQSGGFSSGRKQISLGR